MLRGVELKGQLVVIKYNIDFVSLVNHVCRYGLAFPAPRATPVMVFHFSE